jgi:hypothetical protein
MGLKEKDVKLLWGRAAGRCSICRCELSQDSKGASEAYPLGEHAHIVAESEGGPRGTSVLTSEERNSYQNLILLCPTHHTLIDKDEGGWTSEKLYVTKASHELWVQETLADRVDQTQLAHQVAVTYIVDSAVQLCELENWKDWTRMALAVGPTWPRAFPDQFFEFRQRAGAAIWPEQFDELRRATLTLSLLLNEAARNFMKHSRHEGTLYVADQFYKSGGFNPNYDRDLELYNDWIKRGRNLLRDATAAANWFAEVVRRDLNPMFFAKTGKFVVIEGPFLPDHLIHARLIEFKEEEKATLPGSLDDIEA